MAAPSVASSSTLTFSCTYSPDVATNRATRHAMVTTVLHNNPFPLELVTLINSYVEELPSLFHTQPKTITATRLGTPPGRVIRRVNNVLLFLTQNNKHLILIDLSARCEKLILKIVKDDSTFPAASFLKESLITRHENHIYTASDKKENAKGSVLCDWTIDATAKTLTFTDHCETSDEISSLDYDARTNSLVVGRPGKISLHETNFQSKVAANFTRNIHPKCVYLLEWGNGVVLNCWVLADQLLHCSKLERQPTECVPLRRSFGRAITILGHFFVALRHEDPGLEFMDLREGGKSYSWICERDNQGNDPTLHTMPAFYSMTDSGALWSRMDKYTNSQRSYEFWYRRPEEAASSITLSPLPPRPFVGEIFASDTILVGGFPDHAYFMIDLEPPASATAVSTATTSTAAK